MFNNSMYKSAPIAPSLDCMDGDDTNNDLTIFTSPAQEDAREDDLVLQNLSDSAKQLEGDGLEDGDVFNFMSIRKKRNISLKSEDLLPLRERRAFIQSFEEAVGIHLDLGRDGEIRVLTGSNLKWELLTNFNFGGLGEFITI